MNVFDQFDQPGLSGAPGNPFDQFDPPSERGVEPSERIESEPNVLEGSTAEIIPRQEPEPIERQRTTLTPEQEPQFQQWYSEHAARTQTNPNPDDPRHQYDYRGWWSAIQRDPSYAPVPETNYHGPSEFKDQDHPTMWKDRFLRVTGKDPDKIIPSLIEASPIASAIAMPAMAVAPYKQEARPSALVRGFVRGTISQNPEMAGEAIEGLGEITNSDTLRSAGLALAEKGKEWGKGFEPEVQSFTDIPGKTPLETVGRALTYAAESGGAGVGTSVPSLVTGLAVSALTANPVLGLVLGASAPSFIQNYGDVYGSLKQDQGVANKIALGELTKKDLAMWSVPAGAIMASLDVLSLERLMSPLTSGIKNEIKGYVVREIAKRVAAGATIEGVTEAAQEIISQVTQAYLGDTPLFTKERAISVVDNLLGGIFGGALMGGGARGAAIPQAPQESALDQRVEPTVPPPGQGGAPQGPTLGAPVLPEGALPAEAILPAPVEEQVPPGPERGDLDDLLSDKRRLSEILAEREQAVRAQIEEQGAAAQAEIEATAGIDDLLEIPTYLRRDGSASPIGETVAPETAGGQPSIPVKPPATRKGNIEAIRQAKINDARDAVYVAVDRRGMSLSEDQIAKLADRHLSDRVPINQLMDLVQHGEARGTGEAETPVQIETAGDVHRGAELTADPTPAQAEAGNYRKRHLAWQGMDITIETEQGQERSGVGPDNKPWAIEMPAPYGYLKRTEGKDGDQIDVYVGPTPESETVYIIDQIEPKTGNFDEHKTMLGFDSPADALAIYNAAFNDGSGVTRIGAVTPMSVTEFKTWLHKADTKKPVSYKKASAPLPKAADAQLPPPRAPREAGATPKAEKHKPSSHVAGYGTTTQQRNILVRARQILSKTYSPGYLNITMKDRRWTLVLKNATAADDAHIASVIGNQSQIKIRQSEAARQRGGPKRTGPIGLAEAIARDGGITDPGGELRSMDLDKWHIGKPGMPKLIREVGETAQGDFIGRTDKGKDFSPDGRLTWAIERGYLPEGADLDDLREGTKENILTPDDKVAVEGREAQDRDDEARSRIIEEIKAIDREQSLNLSDSETAAVLERVSKGMPVDDAIEDALYRSAIEGEEQWEDNEQEDRNAAQPPESPAQEAPEPSREGGAGEAPAAAIPEPAPDAGAEGGGTAPGKQPGEVPSRPVNVMPYRADRDVGPSRSYQAPSTEAAKPTPAAAAHVYTLAEHKADRERINSGDMTAEQARATFERAVKDKDAVLAELRVLTKAELTKYTGPRYANEKKDRMIRSAYDAIIGVYHAGDSYTWSPFSEKIEDALRREIGKQTDQTFKDYAKERKERQTKMLQTYTNPQTLDEFRSFISARGMDKLSSEQKAKYDELVAEENKGKAEREREQTATVKAVEIGDVEMSITETKHTQKGHDLFVVKLSKRVEGDVYADLNRKAKQLGGYYSSYAKGGAVPGFQFRTRDAAEKFVALKEGDVSRKDQMEARETQVQDNAIQRLRAMADKMGADADERLGAERLVNTARRARMAASAEAGASADKAMAQTMRNLADAIESGEAKHLDNIRTRVDVETLTSILNRARNEWAQQQLKGDRDLRWEKLMEGPVTDEMIQAATYPYPKAQRKNAADLAKAVDQRPGVKLAARRIAALAEEARKADQWSVVADNSKDREALRTVASEAKRIGTRNQVDDVLESFRAYGRLQNMGLVDLPTLRAALREFTKYRGAKVSADPIKAAERALVGVKIEGFFPTPVALAERMAEEADIKDGMSVLEPSAGSGRIADAVSKVMGDAAANLTMIEQSSQLRDILKLKGYPVAEDTDFLEHKGEYDRIVMNPPFENGQDIDHVRHAYDLLKPGGRIVAIMSPGPFFRSDKKAVAFREWFDAIGGQVEALPEGTFKESGTSVSSRLAIIDKPGPAEEKFALPRSERPFFSALTRGVEAVKVEKAPPGQWRGVINNLSQKGVKQEEVDWSGVLPWLEGQTGTVSKADLVAFLKENEVQVEEVVKGDVVPLEWKPSGDDMWTAKNGAFRIDRLTNGKFRVKSPGGLIDLFDSLEDAKADAEDTNVNIGPDENAAKFATHVLPGGENYRELLLTLPTVTRDKVRPTKTASAPFIEEWNRLSGEITVVRKELDQARLEMSPRYGSIMDRVDGLERERDTLHDKMVDATIAENPRIRGVKQFRSGHFDEPNVVAHVRFNERTDATGKRVLFIEEIQSDWAQKGRREGFKQDESALKEEYEKARKRQIETRTDDPAYAERERETAEAQKRWMNADQGVPTMPFKQSWQELAFKRALRWAAENDFDKIAWTTGEQQAARYDLSKEVKKIAVPMVSAENRSVRIDAKDGKSFKLMVAKDGTVDGVYSGEQFSGKKLDDVVGKEMAEKIMKVTEPTDFTGIDLKVGGEGMKGFYDKILPSFANKYGKKWGAKVGETNISVDSSPRSLAYFQHWAINHGDTRPIPEIGDAWSRGKEDEMVRRFMEDQKQISVHSLPITEAMRESVLQGQPLFAQQRRAGVSVPTDMAAFERDMRAELDRIGLKDIGSKLVEKIRSIKDGKATAADGRYYDKLIEVSRQAAGEGRGKWTINHEAIHALRDLGLFTPAEWNALSRAAHADTERMAEIRRRYKDRNLSEESLTEEAVADMFADWRDGKTQIGGLIRRAFNLIKRAIEAIGNAIKGHGFTTTEGTFERIERGEVGIRQRGIDRAGTESLAVDRKTTDLVDTLDGKREQGVIPGAERISDKELVERRMEGKKRPKVTQKDVGDTPLFDTGARKQGELFSLNREPKNIEERKTVLKTLIEKGHPIDRALRIPFDIFGGVDSKGQWKPGLKLYKKASDAIVGAKFSPLGRFTWMNGILESARAGLVDRYGLTDEYITSEHRRSLDERRILLEGAEVLKSLKEQNISVDEAKVLQSVLTGEAISDENWQRVATPIRQAVDDLGQEAVALGLISAESYERNKGKYLHRVYVKHEGEKNPLGRWVSQLTASKRKKLIGEEMKGRGMFLEANVGRLMRDIPEYATAERGAPIKGESYKVLERFEETPELIEGSREPKPRQRVFWPANKPVPRKFSDFRDQGDWEVRGVEKDKVTLWRDYTKAEREQMGEILDARYTIAKTFMLMAHDIANGRFYKHISENEDWTRHSEPSSRWVNSSDFARFWNDREVQWVRVSEQSIPDSGGSKKWGALAGKWVRAEIWRDLNEIDILNKPGTWKTLLASWKLNKTARSPVVHMNNVMSNVLFMDMADVRARDLIAGIRAYINETADYHEAADNGTFGADIMSQEIKRETLDPILEELQRQAQGDKDSLEIRFGMMGKLAEALWSKAKMVDEKMVEMYRLEDEIFRMATYMRRRHLGDTPQEAADFAREQFLDYDIRAPWVNMARRSVLPFIAYTYRAVPIVAKSIAVHPWKFAKYFMFAYMFNALAYQLAGDDDDEDEERRSLREEEQGMTWIGVPRMIRLPWNDKTGNPMFLDIRRWIPAGDIFDFNQRGAIPWAPIQLGGPVMLAAEFWLNKQAFTGKEITNDKTDDIWDKASKLGDWAWKSWMPSAAYIPGSWYWEKVSRALRGARDYSGNQYSVGEALASSVGVKVKPQDVDVGYEMKAREFSRVERDLKAQMRRAGIDLDRGLISQTEFDRAIKGIERKMIRLNIEQIKTELGPEAASLTEKYNKGGLTDEQYEQAILPIQLEKAQSADRRMKRMEAGIMKKEEEEAKKSRR